MPPTRLVLTVLATGFLSLLPVQASAQTPTTGKVAGVVMDANGKPLPNTNVIIQGLGQGRIANATGRFEFDAVPPGVYSVEARLISYETQLRKDIVVEAGRTVRVDFKLKETIAAALPEYEFSADKIDQLKKEESTTIRTIDSKETSKIRAINTTEEAIATQAGVVQLGDQFFVRGGRSSEVKTVVDGMPVSDAFAGSASVGGTLDISLTSQEGINLLSGGFDAEYGNALSGIVEIITPEGGEEYTGTLRFLTDDFGAPDKTYFNYDSIAFSLGGPVPMMEAWRFFVSGEGLFEDTYLKTLENRPSRKLVFNGTELASLRDRQENNIRGQGKLTRFLGGGKKLTGEYLFSRQNNDWYHHVFSRVGFYSEDAANAGDPDRPAWWFEPLDSTYTYFNGPEHLSKRVSKVDTYKLVYTNPLSSDSYISARIGVFRNRFKESVGGKRPEQYVPFTGNDVQRDPANLFYAVTGDYPVWEERQATRYTLRSDYQNKIGAGTHDMKTGFQFHYHDVRRDDRTNPSEDNPDGNFPNQYHENAWAGEFYIQDKLRYRKTMVMNVGVRLDLFDPGTEAIRVTNQRVLALEKPTSGLSLFERWQAQVSPRLGMSYPISDRDVLHFHYGRSFQLPDLTNVFDFSEAPNSPTQVGNAFLKPETTISYEFGVRRQLSDNLYLDGTVFFKDIFGLIGTEQLEAENETEQDQFASTTFVNKDYGSSRGFELSLQKSFSSYWQGGISYTLSRATGSSSDINQGQIVLQEGQDREPIREELLDWDRTHVLSANVAFSDPGIWQVNFDLSVTSGAPATPRRLGQRATLAEDVNTIRLPSVMNLNLKAQKLYELYGQEFRLFLEGRNILDRVNVRGLQPWLGPNGPDQEYYQEYFTEFGELGGAYNLKDTIGLSEDVLIPLNDPRVYGQPRVFRIGVQFEF